MMESQSQSQQVTTTTTKLLLIQITLSSCIYFVEPRNNHDKQTTPSITRKWKPHSYLESSSSWPWSTSTSVNELPLRWQYPRGGGKLEAEISDLSLSSVATSGHQQQLQQQQVPQVVEAETHNEKQQTRHRHAESISPGDADPNTSTMQHGPDNPETHSYNSPPPTQPSHPTFTSSTRSDFFHHHPFYSRRHLTRSEEKAILGRAVLTTPHRRMPAIRIAPGPRPPFLTPQNPGPIFSSTPIYVTKSTICKSLNCALRDLRIIDQFSYNTSGAGITTSNSGGAGSSTSTASSGGSSVGGGSNSGSTLSIGTSGTSRYAGPAFLARRNCIIVNVGHLRAIVMRDQVIIFVPWDQQKQLNDSGNENNIIQTIDNLVEALVTHLNSIYHSNHHLIVEEGRTTLMSTVSGNENDGNNSNNAMYLTPKYKTSMGQQWGSGWYLNHQEQQTMMTGDEYQNDKKSSNKNGRRSKRKNMKMKRQQDQPKIQNMPITPTAQAPPFELVVIEALLGHVCSHESNKASLLIQTAQDVLSGITYTDNSSNKKKDAFLEMQRKLGELLPLKNKVDELEAKCSEVASAIADVLKNDEDMAAMRLSEIAMLRDLDSDFAPDDKLLVKDGDPYNLHVEVELLFEDYLLQMDEVLHSLRSLQSSITNTEEVVEIELDLLRNRIMRYEMLLELSGLIVGIAAAVTGALGMNLVNHFEDHPTMFYQISLGLVVFMGVMGYAILRKLSMDSIL